MAKGDVFIESLAAAGSIQPASGVEMCITSVSNTPANGPCGWFYDDGAIKGYFAYVPAYTSIVARESSVKVFINNTTYITTAAAGGTVSGVQVK